VMAGSPVLLYHRIVEKATPGDPLAVSLEIFERQMRALHTWGIHAASLGSLEAGRGRPTRAVGLTFDDGYREFLYHALPILKRHGFTATVFVVTDRVGRRADWAGADGPALLGWEEIRELAASGIEFGSHSRTHPRLDALSDERLHEEIDGSKRDLEDALATPVRWMSYPYGASNEAVRRAARGAGYDAAFGVLSGPPGPYNRGRFECRERDGRFRMLLKTMPGFGRVARITGKTHLRRHDR